MKIVVWSTVSPDKLDALANINIFDRQLLFLGYFDHYVTSLTFTDESLSSFRLLFPVDALVSLNPNELTRLYLVFRAVNDNDPVVLCK
jgi:hypothetical protein